MPIGPGAGSAGGDGPSGDSAVRPVVPVSVVWLALAAVIGLLFALVCAKRPSQVPASPEQKESCKHHQDEQPARSVRYAAAALLVAMIAAVLSFFLYNWLDHWYLPVTLTAATTNLGNGPQLSLTGDGGPAVQWSMTGFADHLTVVSSGTAGLTSVMLPVSPSSCPKVTANLGVACGTSGISLPSPAEFSWSIPQLLFVGSETAAELDIQTSTGARSVPSVIVSVTKAHPELCFSPQTAAVLTISVGKRTYTQPFRGFAQCNGIVATFGSPGTMPPALELDGIYGLKLHASAPDGTLSQFSGQITLTGWETSVQSSPTLVTLRSAGAAKLSAMLNVAPGSQSLTVGPTATASAMTSAGQLIPSVWARESDVFVPVFGVLVAAAVGTPLGTSLKVLLTRFERGPGPRRTRKGKARRAL
jgi:hypothetical protein